MKKRVLAIAIGLLLVGGILWKTHPHDYKKTTINEPTCMENGNYQYKCWCGNNYSEEVEALGHDLEIEKKEPTCEEIGYEKEICGRCNYIEEKEYEVLGHKYELKEENESEKIYICENCNITLTQDKDQGESASKDKGNTGNGGNQGESASKNNGNGGNNGGNEGNSQSAPQSTPQTPSNGNGESASTQPAPAPEPQPQPAPEQPQASSGGISDAERDEILRIATEMGSTFGDVTGEVEEFHVDPNAAENSGVDLSGVTLH